MTYDNFQLYRMTPKLCGNMKWDLIVKLKDGSTSELEVVDFHIRPISPLIPYALVTDDNLLVRPHQMNIKNFYNDTHANFFECPVDPKLDSDWPYILPKDTTDEEILYIHGWDDTYWAGTQRMLYSTYHTTHETMIPVWLEQITGKLSFNIMAYDAVAEYVSSSTQTFTLDLEPDSDRYKPRRKQTFHERFCDYLFDYFKYIGLDEGNNYCMNIDFTQKKCFMNGLDVKSGNLITRTDDNITRNLVSRERPLLEQNSIITNAFRDVGMILPQMMVFNITFDMNGIGMPTFYCEGQVLTEIHTSVSVDGVELEKRDLYTNHHFIPRFDCNTESDSLLSDQRVSVDKFKVNALDYLDDYDIVDLIHKNKINQVIPHWSPVGSDMLFNVYDGFGSYFYDSNDKLNILSHQYGQIQSYQENVWNNYLGNWNWTGKVLKVNSSNLEYITNLGTEENLDYLVNNGYLIPLSKYFNNMKYDFEDGDENYYLGIALYGDDVVSSNGWASGFNETVGFDTNSFIMSIWDDRFDNYTDDDGVFHHNQSLSDFGTLVYNLDSSTSGGNDQKLINDTYHGSPNSSILGLRDHDRDCTIHTDFNNRFGIFLHDIDSSVAGYNKPNENIDGFIYNSGQWSVSHQPGWALEKCHKLTISFYKDNDKTYILFSAWQDSGTSKLFEGYYSGDDEGKNSNLTSEEPYLSKNPECIMLGNIIQALKDYTSYYTLKLNEWSALGYNGEDSDGVKHATRSELSDARNFTSKISEIKDKLLKFVDPEVIYFENSVYPLPNKDLNIKTREKDYYKVSNQNNYVLRFSDNIKPMMVKKCFTEDGGVVYGVGITDTVYKKYGYNLFWSKDIFKLDDLLVDRSNYTSLTDEEKRYEAYKKFAYTNISPLYTSVSYDPIYNRTYNGYEIYQPDSSRPIVQAHVRMSSNMGGLLVYSAVPPELRFGQDNPGIEESKWFDKSVIRGYEINPDPWDVYVWINEKDDLEDAVLDHYKEYYTNQETPLNITKTYMKKIYNIYYSLVNIECFDNPEDAIEAVEDKENATTLIEEVNIGTALGDDGLYILYHYIIDLELK